MIPVFQPNRAARKRAARLAAKKKPFGDGMKNKPQRS